MDFVTYFPSSVTYSRYTSSSLAKTFQVILRSPKLIDVPFFAFPFRFPKLEAIPEKFTDAVKSFDTESILTGLYVSKSGTFFRGKFTF